MGRACSSAGSDPKAADPGGPSLKQNMAAAAVAGRAAAAALLVLQRVRVAHAAAAVRVVVVRAGFVAAVLVPALQCAACAACSQLDQSG